MLYSFAPHLVLHPFIPGALGLTNDIFHSTKDRILLDTVSINSCQMKNCQFDGRAFRCKQSRGDQSSRPGPALDQTYEYRRE